MSLKILKMMELLIAMVTICIMVSLTALAEEQETFLSGDYEYTLLDDGTAEITKYYGDSYAPEIPSALDGYPVTVIGSYSFNRNHTLTDIVIPKGIIRIEDYAFQWCEYLSSIKLPDGLDSIGKSAFAECPCLKRIELSDGLESIGDTAFGGCNSLESIDFPDTTSTLGKNPFARCGKIAFHVSPDHDYLAVIDGVLFSKQDKKLVCCPNTKDNYAVPDGIQIIGSEAFNSCDCLYDITMSDSVQTIEERAFVGCTNLNNVTLSEGLIKICSWAFRNCVGLDSITLPNSITTIEDNPFCDCGELSFNVASSHAYLEVIDGVLFSKPDKRLISCPDIKESYTVPENTEVIGGYAFFLNEKLTDVLIMPGLTTIEDFAFNYCDNLTSIVLPETINSISEYSFDSLNNNLLITVSRDSYADEFCEENGLNYTYPDANDWLNS